MTYQSPKKLQCYCIKESDESIRYVREIPDMKNGNQTGTFTRTVLVYRDGKHISGSTTFGLGK